MDSNNVLAVVERRPLTGLTAFCDLRNPGVQSRPENKFLCGAFADCYGRKNIQEFVEDALRGLLHALAHSLLNALSAD